MNRHLVVAGLLLFAGCFPVPPPPPQTVVVAPKFDRSWDAALGAAADVGIEVRKADRAGGRISGTKAGIEVTIDVLRQPDGNLRVEFAAPGSPETNPKLSERWQSAYQRRMGR